jgi:Type I phosphodiesterase / nucleotide pyrophosphatase
MSQGFDPAAPAGLYSDDWLGDVLPAVAAALGTPLAGFTPTLEVTPTPRAVVVLVDGLGFDLLQRRRGHAPFLRSLLGNTRRLTAGFPSTTATSMGTFGTGRPPGTHGLLGYEVLAPDHGALLNELTWNLDIDPVTWQPVETVFEAMRRQQLPVTFVGPGKFAGSGLTEAALRGASFSAADPFDRRVDNAVAAIRASPTGFVYLYWGFLDRVGHQKGCESYEWGDELAHVDAQLARLAASVPDDCAILITADHGMVDSPEDDRVDIALDPALATGVRLVGGEPRCRQLYVDAGATDEVAAAWTEVLGDRAAVWTRSQAIEAGLFGPVRSEAAPRIGNVVVAMRNTFTVVDSRTMSPSQLGLVGHHGSLTSDEVGVPLVTIAARSAG